MPVAYWAPFFLAPLVPGTAVPLVLTTPVKTKADVMDLRRFVNAADSGRRPRATRRAALVTAPEVRGLSAGQAHSVLRREGLKMAGPRMGLTRLEVDSSGLPDLAVGLTVSVLSSWLESRSRRVATQSPPGGTTARRGDTIAVWHGESGQGPAAYA